MRACGLSHAAQRPTSYLAVQRALLCAQLRLPFPDELLGILLLLKYGLEHQLLLIVKRAFFFFRWV